MLKCDLFMRIQVNIPKKLYLIGSSMHGTGESYPYPFLANQFTAFDLDGDEFVTKEEIRQGLFSIVYRTVSSSNLKQ